MPIKLPPEHGAEEEWNEFFRSHGEPKLRLLMANGGWPQSLHLRTAEWLAGQEKKAAARGELVQAEQTEIARSSKDAAWVSANAAERSAKAAETANKRATLALIVAGISILATIAVAGLVHYDALHTR